MGIKIDKKTKTNKVKLTTMILILLLAVFFIVISQTTVFNVKKIIVEGNSELSKEKIILASGIVSGENILKLDTRLSKENLLLHPYIKSVEIKRDLPDKVLIKVLEKAEVAAISYLDSYVYMGYDGVVLDILKEKKDNKVPLVSGLSIEHPSIGSKLTYKNKKDKDSKIINHFLESLSDKGLKDMVNSIVFNKNKEVNLILLSGTNVAFGDLDDTEYKIRFLIKTLEDLEKRKVKAKNIYLNKSNDIIVEVVDS